MHCDFHSQASHLAAVIVPLGTGLPLWHISCGTRASHLARVSLVPRVLYAERPLWVGFASDSICLDTVTCPFGQGRTLRFPILFVVQVPARTSAIKVPPIKINFVLFPITVLRSLSFLIPSFTKNKHVILSCGTSPSNICLRSTRGVP